MTISTDREDHWDRFEKVIVVQNPASVVYGIWIYEIDGWLCDDHGIVFNTIHQEVAAAQLRRRKQTMNGPCTDEVREIAISGVARGATKLTNRRPAPPKSN